jgi:cyclase
VTVPLVALGGAATLEDIKKAVAAGASAAAAGSMFVFHGPHKAVLITYPTRETLKETFG